MVKIIMDDGSIKSMSWYWSIPEYLWWKLIWIHYYWSYQWNWIMASYKNNKIELRRWWYGSCSVCDNYEWTFWWEDEAKQKDADDFCYAYSPEYSYDISDFTFELFNWFCNKISYDKPTDKEIKDFYDEIMSYIKNNTCSFNS